MKKKKRIKKTVRKKYMFSHYREGIAYTETTGNIPVTLNEQKTYRITESKKGFKIYELNRKEKPKSVKYVRKSKDNRNKRDVEANVKRNKIKIRKIYITENQFKGSKTEIVQSDHRPTTQRKQYQLVAIVDVYDTKRNIADAYTCFSTKVYKSQEHQAIADLKRMAIAKFCSEHGQRTDSKDNLETRVRRDTIRYQYVRKKV